jgi:hypothetical protein
MMILALELILFQTLHRNDISCICFSFAIKIIFTLNMVYTLLSEIIPFPLQLKLWNVMVNVKSIDNPATCCPSHELSQDSDLADTSAT